VIAHDEARALINDAFNAQAERTMQHRWNPDLLGLLADRRRAVLEYMEHLKREAEGKETQR
jgi:hypothetical protein